MCGIAGYIGNEKLSNATVNSTLEKMNNRGPDSKSHVFFNNAERGQHVFLLHSRLSIIDLSDRATQPFFYKDLVCTFNGEIYNYIEIRNKLKNKGYTFDTSSDTEVLIKAYHLYGEKCTDYFEGMWAFAVYNKTTKELFISRDRFGEKPIYYYLDENKKSFVFGSEIKFIKSLIPDKKFNVDEEYLREFLVLGHKNLYKNSKKCSFFEGVSEAKPGENILVGPDLKITKSKYWIPELNIQEGYTREYWVEKTRENLIKSLELRMRADVPLSFCLSGGIDSGSLVSIASKVMGIKNIHTFSIIDSDQRYNESHQINSVIRDTKCKNYSVALGKSDYFDKMRDLSLYRNGPICTSSYFVHSLLIEKINKLGFKIAVSGVGADEMFTGYFDHFSYYLKHLKNINSNTFFEELQSWEKFVSPNVRNQLIKDLSGFYQGGYRKHIFLNSEDFNGFLTKPVKTDFKEEKYCNSPELRNRMLNEMFHEVVRVILHQDDMNSMFHSVENRSPFLDKGLFEMTMKIPSKHLINMGYNKSILRDAMKGILHDDVRLFREKRGFNASITSFLDFKSKKFVDFIERDSLIYNIVKKDNFKAILTSESYPNSYNKFIFRVISSKMFFDQM